MGVLERKRCGDTSLTSTSILTALQENQENPLVERQAERASRSLVQPRRDFNSLLVVFIVC